MWRYLSFALVFCALNESMAIYPKCCALHHILYKSVLKEDGSVIYVCHENKNKRNYISSNEHGYLFKNCSNNSYYCIDHIAGEENGSVFKVKCENHTFEATPVKLPVYSKCCPLEYYYDTTNHRCIRDASRFKTDDSVFRNENANIKVGLAECKTVITDKIIYGDLLNNVPTNFLKSCVDKTSVSNETRPSYVIRTCEDDFKACEKKKCIRKCCPDGESYDAPSHCTATHDYGVNLMEYTTIKNPQDDFALIHGSKCKKYVGYENKYDFYLDEDGYFHIKLYRNPFYVSFAPDEEMYCLEHVEAKGLKGDYFFICFQANSTKFKFQVTRIGLILSCIFLLLTLFGYGFLPEMQNLFGKTLMCYCSALLLLFALLAHLQFNQNISNNRDICAAYGFLIMCSSLASFAWLNTMCFDIWWTFGKIHKLLCRGGNEVDLLELEKHQVFELVSHGTENPNHEHEVAPKGSLSIQQRDRERKRFIWYNIYGWCVPILLTAITSALHYTKILPKSIHPEIGGSKCYFEKINNNYGYQIFFVLPITIIFVCNAILFIKTVVYCMKVKSEINKMNDTNAAKSAKKKGFIADKEKMMLLLKLFIVMGISWLFEAVSSMISFEDNTYLSIIEIVWDTINSLQGVFIFLIFICKRKILEAYKKKFGMKQRRQSITSGATHSTSLMSKQNSAKDTTKSI